MQLLSSNDRIMRERHFAAIQDRIAKAHAGVRDAQPKPHDWAFSFADRPRAFMNEIIEGWRDPHWTAWRAFISAVFNEPLETAGELHAFRSCTQLTELPGHRMSSVWMPVGRRGGKSRMLAAIAVYLATCYSWLKFLVPGEIGVLPILAQDRRSAHTIMSYVKSFLEHPKLAPLVVTSQIESVRLEGQILIEVVTANFRAIRNRTVVAALLDEIAFWSSDEESANPDHEILNALEPAMATIPNALILGASSPYAQRGVLWDQYEKYYGKAEGPLVWKAATRVMNPTVPQSFLDEKYDEDPVAAAAEYGAEFRSDVDAFVTREVLDAATMRDVFELPPVYNTRYFCFVDPSGGASDSMTMAIGHISADGRDKRAVLDLLREVRAPFSPETVVAEFSRVMKEYKISRCSGDRYAGEWPRDRFKAHGINYVVSEKHKSDLYIEFLPLLNSGRCDLLDDRRMYRQFVNLERRTTSTGREIVDHQPGGHDDIANVVSGLFVGLLGKNNPTFIDPKVLAASARIMGPYNVPLGTRHHPVWG